MEIWKNLFKNKWGLYNSALLIGFINTMLFATDSPWSVFSGLRNWGLHLLELIPRFPDVAQRSPLEFTGSVMNIAFLLGAFSSSMLANEFSLRIPTPREAAKGIIGGVLMGIGANFSIGCNVGGFYSSISALSVSGLCMMLGLFLGIILGLKYLKWEMKKNNNKTVKPGPAFSPPPAFQIIVGVCVFLSGIFVIPYYYDYLGLSIAGVIFCLAFLLGIVCQRSKFCFLRIFREPFLSGNAEMTKAAIVAFLVSISGFSILKFVEIKDLTAQVASSAGLPAIIGGFIFGLGMVRAGSCASASLWRAGEGFIKLWLVLLSFALSAAGTHLILQLKFEYSYVRRMFLPDVFNSWSMALLLVFGIMILWYWIVSWNERTLKLVMQK